ncbi:Reverse transcriptase (RNA-dependent DNA polymerase) [Phytophthora infestans]|uniref:Reverse transcriptase (RNA-dependent DNA polymerase) n=1 Tax=Phytophthora infestans TaxID=4787 RepID=A0A8S9U8L5_PHYIN|nr:Reverse transcriptase (RNA-dependent DNA polymerase) [Phytophthora infestans]
MQAMKNKYQFKDLGDVRWFLGIEITMDPSSGGTTLDQYKFAVELLRRFGMDDCRPRKTSLDHGVLLYSKAPDEDDAGMLPTDKLSAPCFILHELQDQTSPSPSIKSLFTHPTQAMRIGMP